MTIFVSHSSHDNSTVRALLAELPSDLTCWLDEDKLAFDRDLPHTLEEVLCQESDLVLAFLSRHSCSSTWVEREMLWAIKEEIRREATLLLPVLLDDLDEHPGLPHLLHRHHLRITDTSRMGLQYAARKLERMLYRFLLERTVPLSNAQRQVALHATPTRRNNRILILREGSGVCKKYAVIKCCPDLGLRPTVIDTFCSTDTLAFDAIKCDPRNWEQLLQLLESDIEAHGAFANVVTFEELEVLNTARLAQYLGCERRISVAAAKRCRDKLLAREALAAAGIPQVGYCVAAHPAEARANIRAKRLRFPLIVKPRNGAASVGVERVNSPDQIECAFRLVRQDVERVRHGEGGRWQVLDSSTLLIEEYIAEGEEVEPREMSVEGIVNEGEAYILAIHQKLEMRKRPPYFEPVFLSPPLPGAYSEAELQSIAALVPRALRALGVDYGPFHAELRMGRNGPVILEVGARPGGGIIPESVVQRRGVDIRHLALKVAIGTFDPARDIPPIRSTATCLGIVYPEVRGVLDAVAGVTEEELEHRHDVFYHYPILSPGTKIVQEELSWLLDVGVCSPECAKDAYDRFCAIRQRVHYTVNGCRYQGRNLAINYSPEG